MKIALSVLSVGDLYELFTRLYIKKLDKIYDKEINLCITSDRNFSDKINSKKVICHFNILDEEVVKPSGFTLPGHGKSTYFKYYLKSLALKYTTISFPQHSICHTDCDILPTNNFSDEAFDSLKEPGLYCSSTVRCSGDYHRFQNDDGSIIINEKLKKIINHFIPDFDDFASVICPIENRLYFHDIPQENLIKFSDTWLEIGKFVEKTGLQRYGDCYEIKPACMIHGIDVICTNLLPYDDNFKGEFADLFNKRFLKNCSEEYKNLNDEEFLEYYLKKIN